MIFCFLEPVHSFFHPHVIIFIKKIIPIISSFFILLFKKLTQIVIFKKAPEKQKINFFLA